MKILVLSDLHLEFEPIALDATDADVVVLAGDIHIGVAGVMWAARVFKERPVVYVMGNHEYYGQALSLLPAQLRAAAEGTNVHVLERERVIIDGVAFLGCTLWTDMLLHGALPRISDNADERMSDYRQIRATPEGDAVRAADTMLLHQRSRRWLADELSRRGGRLKKVVVTHHAPSPRSLASDERDDPISAAYASRLDDLIEDIGPELWIHGHIHTAQRYRIGRTKVVANPRGYPARLNPRFNRQFDPTYCIEL